MGKVQIISKKHVGWETRVGETTEREIARVWLAVTTANDLPSKYDLNGITIHEGSRGWDITNGTNYGYVEGTGWCLQKDSVSAEIVQIKGTVASVNDLPSNAEPGWLYFVKPLGATDSDEYIYTEDDGWDKVGSTAVTITVDDELSSTSENPVQNKVITSALGDKADKTATVSTVTWDNQNGKLTKTINGIVTDVMATDATPTDGSKNPVQSDGVYDALERINETVNYSHEETTLSPVLEKGAIGSNGANAPSEDYDNTSCRTGYFEIGNIRKIKIAAQFSAWRNPSFEPSWFINVNFYKSDNSFISRRTNSYSDTSATTKEIMIDNIPATCMYIRISYTFREIWEVSNIVTKYDDSPLCQQVRGLSDTVITNGIFLGDSISFGVYSYFANGQRKNADDYTQVLADTRAQMRISDWFSGFALAPMDNIAQRGTGYVADTRNLGNGWVKAQATDFSAYDFCALCFGVNDYIQGKTIGDIGTSVEGTVIGNMMRILNKIYTDNPYCKVVVFSPYNTWGQWRDTQGALQTLYGDFNSNYALGHAINGNTLQDFIDAINSVCQYYGVECIDLNRRNFINRINIKNILVDGLHPTAKSMKALATEMYRDMTFR